MAKHIVYGDAVISMIPEKPQHGAAGMDGMGAMY